MMLSLVEVDYPVARLRRPHDRIAVVASTVSRRTPKASAEIPSLATMAMLALRDFDEGVHCARPQTA